MYTPGLDIDPKAYDEAHIDDVLKEIGRNFTRYFDSFSGTSKNTKMDQALSKLGSHFKVDIRKEQSIDRKSALEDKFEIAIDEFESDRQRYKEILDLEALEEDSEDPPAFKDHLRSHCPIIHRCLWSKAKEMEKYKAAFNQANALDMVNTVCNIAEFGQRFMGTFDEDKHEIAEHVSDLRFSDLLEEDYTVYGVIGNGIRSHFLFKLFPEAFPNRSQNSLWALYYLVGNNTFGFKEDSEFLMIDVDNNITQQNYHYPYDLFGFYALKLFLMIKHVCEKYGVVISSIHRYVYLDAFIEYIADYHIDEILELKKKITYDYVFGY